MSLPNYLAKIKSAGVYRFVWDKSVVPPQQAETLRLVVGYSEKGPFNTPVYIENISDFKTIYGNISKRLERKGVYFHRMAEQALQAGPILALNLKPFNDEQVSYAAFNGGEVIENTNMPEISVKDLYDTNRFWKLDENLIPAKLSAGKKDKKYFNIVATDSKDTSCSFFIKRVKNESYSGITFRSWYASQGIEVPEYMESILDQDMSDFFASVYVFRGEFTENVMSGSLQKYFTQPQELTEGDENSQPHSYTLNFDYTDAFGQKVDVLDALSSDSNSNFIGAYMGCTIPYFKDANGNYISLDIKFNADYNSHKMLMKMDEIMLDSDDIDIKTILNPTDTTTPIYLTGYTYTSPTDYYASIANMLKESKGVRTALTNRVDVEYHYIIDTFDSQSNKVELFAIAKEKDNAFAIVNFPKMSSFNSIEAIKEKFTMPSESEGASFGAYYTQLVFSDGTVKTVVPSAALVSNNFMQKWGPRQPYYIVAGPNYGALSYNGLVGPDYNFGRADLDILEPMGVNAVIYVPRLGTYINSNQTAKQIPVSGLSKVHIRELVIFLQNEIERLLQSYQWEMNTQTLRDTIRAKADAICDTIKNNGGIYAFVNVCDETNNTSEVIDNEMIILDTEIEPARGAGKMVHQLTIHKTGGLTSSVK